MLRTFREQLWYLFFWLPLGIGLGLFAYWSWAVAMVLGGWTLRWDEAPIWLGVAAFVAVFDVLFIIFMFPRRPARSPKVATLAAGLMAVILAGVYYANTVVVTFQVSDVDGGPLQDIPIAITHHANEVALTDFPGKFMLRTDEQGKAVVRIFKSEQCVADVNGRYDDGSEERNVSYSGDTTLVCPIGSIPQPYAVSLAGHTIIRHGYGLNLQGGLASIAQECMASPSNMEPWTARVYLRRSDSMTLPPYYDQIMAQKSSSDPCVQTLWLMSMGGSIKSFDHLDELLSSVAKDDASQDFALGSLHSLAVQMGEISLALPGLYPGKDVPRAAYATEAQRETGSQMIYAWMAGENAAPLSHLDRLAYIKQRMNQTALKVIEAIHPAMLKTKRAYQILGDLMQLGRPAMKFYPEVFAKGTDEARSAALGAIYELTPSADDVAFLIRSKNKDWIQRASGFSNNSTMAELADDLKRLEILQAQESDPEIKAAFDLVIGAVTKELAIRQPEEKRQEAK